MSEAKSNGNAVESGVVNSKNIPKINLNPSDEKKLKVEASIAKEDIKEEKEKKESQREKDPEKDKKEKDKDKEREKKKKKNKDSKKKKKKHGKSKERSRSRSNKRKSKKSRSKSRSRTAERQRKRKRSNSIRRKKRKSPSSSQSKSKSKSPSKKKSKTSRSKSISKRTKFRFDSPPKDKNALLGFENPILAAALTQSAPIQPPVVNPVTTPPMANNGPPPVNMGQQQQQQPNQSPAELLQKIQMLNTLQNIQASKSDRKLYIGNLPSNLTPQTLCDVLNSALQKMGVNTNPGNSIVSAWISNDGHYAFVEFRTPEEANNGFALNNVALFGQHLKVGRPRTYAATQALSQGSMMMPGLNNMLPGLNPLNPLGAANQMFATANSTIKVQPPSRIIVLKNMIQIHELEIDEEYNEIFEDVKEECSKYGEVLSIKIPRPKFTEMVPGLGKVFVEFGNIEQAKEARKNLAGRTFSNNTVECSYHDERMYAENNLMEI